jgi:hypothetical protein
MKRGIARDAMHARGWKKNVKTRQGMSSLEKTPRRRKGGKVKGRG